MKIKNLNDIAPKSPTVTSRTSAPAAEAPAARPASASVTLSPLSSGIAAAASGLKDVDGDFDASRVAEVRQALDQGRYTIDAGRIADAVISQMALSASPRLQ